MSLYAEYILEREGKKIIENDKGFITYLEIEPSKTIYVSDFYIKKEARGTGLAKKLCDELEEILKEKNYKFAMAGVDLKTKNWEHSKNILENYGFKPSGEDGSMIYFIKEFNYG